MDNDSFVQGGAEWVGAYNVGYEVFGTGEAATKFADETGLLPPDEKDDD